MLVSWSWKTGGGNVCKQLAQVSNHWLLGSKGFRFFSKKLTRSQKLAVVTKILIFDNVWWNWQTLGSLAKFFGRNLHFLTNGKSHFGGKILWSLLISEHNVMKCKWKEQFCTNSSYSAICDILISGLADLNQCDLNHWFQSWFKSIDFFVKKNWVI